MPFDPTLTDKKGNIVAVTEFETFLAKFIVEHPAYYQAIYKNIILDIIKYLDSDHYLTNMKRTDKDYERNRHLFSIFTRINEEYPKISSTTTLFENFSLSAAEYFIKLVTDECFLTTIEPKKYERISESEATLSPRFFIIDAERVATRRSPIPPRRSPLLFSERNRGVVPIEDVEDEFTNNLGIMSPEYSTDECKTYFDRPIVNSRNLYSPNPASHVAKWLRQRNLPLITGASGSSEAMISRIFPLTCLSEQEKRLVLFVQAANLVAHGYHSFGECMIVANDFGFTMEDTSLLSDYYLQFIPNKISASDEFVAEYTDHLSLMIAEIPFGKESRKSPGMM